MAPVVQSPAVQPVPSIQGGGFDQFPESVDISISGESVSGPSGSGGFTVVDPTHSQLGSEKQTRQTLIDRVNTSKTKLLAMPMAGSSKFQSFRSDLELDL